MEMNTSDPLNRFSGRRLRCKYRPGPVGFIRAPDACPKWSSVRPVTRVNLAATTPTAHGSVIVSAPPAMAARGRWRPPSSSAGPPRVRRWVYPPRPLPCPHGPPAPPTGAHGSPRMLPTCRTQSRNSSGDDGAAEAAAARVPRPLSRHDSGLNGGIP